MIDQNTIDTITKRGVEEIIIESEFINLLKENKPLRLKMGFDPSSSDIHLGHAVGLKKLRQLQDIGHKCILIIGDWTARIGDPTGVSATRKMLTQEEVESNAKTYLEQFFKIVDIDQTEVVYQSEWYGDFKLENVIELTSKFTVAQFLAREDFNKRYKQGKPIAITEFLYPLLQAYDSVAINSDVEFGGTDQKFNLLVGRELQSMNGMKPQQCLMVPLLVGTDGINKMSKSLNNYIGITDKPADIYGKVMSIPDNIIMNYLEVLSNFKNNEIEEMKKAMSLGNENPMIFKKELAKDIVTQFYTIQDAIDSELNFKMVVQGNEIPENLENHDLNEMINSKLSNILVKTSMAKSNSEAKRLINQGAIELNGVKLTEDTEMNSLKDGDIFKIGKQKFFQVSQNA